VGPTLCSQEVLAGVSYSAMMISDEYTCVNDDIMATKAIVNHFLIGDHSDAGETPLGMATSTTGFSLLSDDSSLISNSADLCW